MQSNAKNSHSPCLALNISLSSGGVLKASVLFGSVQLSSAATPGSFFHHLTSVQGKRKPLWPGEGVLLNWNQLKINQLKCSEKQFLIEKQEMKVRRGEEHRNPGSWILHPESWIPDWTWRHLSAECSIPKFKWLPLPLAKRIRTRQATHTPHTHGLGIGELGSKVHEYFMKINKDKNFKRPRKVVAAWKWTSSGLKSGPSADHWAYEQWDLAFALPTNWNRNQRVGRRSTL